GGRCRSGSGGRRGGCRTGPGPHRAATRRSQQHGGEDSEWSQTRGSHGHLFLCGGRRGRLATAARQAWPPSSAVPREVTARKNLASELVISSASNGTIPTHHGCMGSTTNRRRFLLGTVGLAGALVAGSWRPRRALAALPPPDAS